MTRGCEPNQMIPADQELLERALEGDEGAFAALYRLRQAAVYRFALHMSGSAAVAEDVTQETFLELLSGGAEVRFGAGNAAVVSIWSGSQFRDAEDRTRAGGAARRGRHGFGGRAGRSDAARDRRTGALRGADAASGVSRGGGVVRTWKTQVTREAAVALDCPVGTVQVAIEPGSGDAGEEEAGWSKRYVPCLKIES